MKYVWIALLIVGLLPAGLGPARADEEQNAQESSEQQDTREQTGEIKKLVEQLGHEDYWKRAEAYKKLKAIGEPALEEIKKALEGEDPEIRVSAQRLIDEIANPDGRKEQPEEQIPPPLPPNLRVLPFGPGNARIIIRPALGGIEMKLKTLEGFAKRKPPEKLLIEVEKEFIQLIKRIDEVERLHANRTLKDSLDMDRWALRPACELSGIRVRPADETLKAHLNIKGGLVVTELHGDTAFTQALKVHDIITEFDGTAVSDIKGLNKAFDRAKSEKKEFALRIIRDGKEQAVAVDWTYDPPAHKQRADSGKKAEEPEDSTGPHK